MVLFGDEDKLFVGPFIGEFGHELFSWQAYAREFAKDYEHVVVSTRKELEFIYEDFCDEFVPIDPKTYNAASFTVLENVEENEKMCKRLRSRYNINKKYTVLSPNIDSEETTYKKLTTMTPYFIPYGVKDDDLFYDVIIHPRNFGNFTNHKQAENKKSRDWSLDKWNKLVKRFNDMGLKVGCIGLSTTAFHVEGTEDLRDISLKTLANILRSSKCIMGPSSGPLHFATLCECPQLIWSHPRNKSRYHRLWNPFGVKVAFHDKDLWNPSVDTVFKIYTKFEKTL